METVVLIQTWAPERSDTHSFVIIHIQQLPETRRKQLSHLNTLYLLIYTYVWVRKGAVNKCIYTNSVNVLIFMFNSYPYTRLIVHFPLLGSTFNFLTPFTSTQPLCYNCRHALKVSINHNFSRHIQIFELVILRKKMRLGTVAEESGREDQIISCELEKGNVS